MKAHFALFALLLLTACSIQASTPTQSEQFFESYCKQSNSGIDCADFVDAMANAEGRFIPDRCGGFSGPISCTNYFLTNGLLQISVSTQEQIVSATVSDGVNTYSCVVSELLECDVSGSIEHNKEGYVITVNTVDGSQYRGSVLVSAN